MRKRRAILLAVLLAGVVALRAAAQETHPYKVFLPLVDSVVLQTFTPTPTVTATPTATATPPPSNTPPPWSTSYYVDTTSMNDMAAIGCGIGTHHANTPGAQDSLVILAFGKPTNVNGQLGVSGMFVNGHVPLPTVVELVKEVADFYRACSAADPASHLRIGIGTSNYGSYVTYAHGAAWADVVNQVNAWLLLKGYYARVDAYGASDMELSWNTPAVTRAWVNGYDSVNLYPLINFGDAAGCPTRLDPSLVCANGWTSEDRWMISYGMGSAYPLPLIYANPSAYAPESSVNARQWAWLSKYAADVHGYRMDFLGTMTQYQACQQTGDPNCALLDNTPDEGWSYLYYELSLYPQTRQWLRYSTDIKWWYW